MLRYRDTESSPLLGRENSGDRNRRRQAACITISLTQMLERITFYGVFANMVLFLNQEPLHWPDDDAIEMTFIFTGLSYMCSIVGGILADSFFGRFLTILGSFLIYITGMVLLTFLGYAVDHGQQKFEFLCGKENIEWVKLKLNTGPAPINSSGMHEIEKQMHGNCKTPVYIALVLIALGTSMIRANISPFGGDQVKNEHPTVMMRAFFNWFYWASNIGSFIGLVGVAYIQQNRNFFIGYIIPTVALGLSVILFVLGRPFYTLKKPTGSVLADICRIVAEAFRGRSRRRHHFARQDSNHILSPLARPSLLDMAKVRYGGICHDSMVDDVKSLSAIILVFVALIPYWIVYFQMNTTFLLQGFHMRVTVKRLCDYNSRSSNNTNCMKPGHNFQFPAAWLTIFNVVTVLFMIPLMERIVYPYLDRRGWHISLLKRINIGMIFIMLAVICAGVLEIYRLERLNSSEWLQTIGTTQYSAANMWIFWQIPQYALIGLSEVFASIAGLEFAYSQAPKSMHSLIMGLFYMSAGLGNVFGELLYSFTSEWKKLWKYFFLLAGIQFFTIVTFSLVSRAYEARKTRQGAIAIPRSVTPQTD